MKKIKVSVIIPAYNRSSVTEKCIRAICNQSVDSDFYEVILVDDHSTDNTKELSEVLSLEFPNIRYYRNEINFGRSKTRNIGISMAVGQWLIFLDNDLIVDYDFIKVYSDAFLNATDSYAFLGKTCYPSTETAKSNLYRYLESRAVHNQIYSKTSPNKCLDFKFFAGGNSACSRNAAIEIGCFDEKLRYYGGEDEEFGLRLKQRGVKLFLLLEATAIHFDFGINLKSLRSKYLEYGMFAFNYFRDSGLTHFSSDNMSMLLPIDFKNDGLLLICKKFLTRLMSFIPFFKLVEAFLIRTDKVKWLYSKHLFRLILFYYLHRGVYSENKKQLVKY